MKPDTLKVLELFAEKDDCDSIWWRCDKMEWNGEVVDYSPVTFFVGCNDLFYWGCADCEEIRSDQDVKHLRKAYDDCRELFENGECYGPELWVARKRGMRPQDPCYKQFPRELHALFNECGPERTKKEQG